MLTIGQKIVAFGTLLFLNVLVFLFGGFLVVLSLPVTIVFWLALRRL